MRSVDRVTVRDATSEDLGFVKLMLYEAANRPGDAWPGFEESMNDPKNRRFWGEFPRPGDVGVIAQSRAHPIGAAWIRTFVGAERGRWDDAEVPVLAIGVVEGWRGRGVGGVLIDALLERARSLGVRAIDLTAGSFNEAGVRLYHSFGFVDIATHGDVIRMRATLV